MTVFTDDEARRALDSVLDEAREQGEVRIRRRDGQEFVVRPAQVGATPGRSPLDVGAVDLLLTSEEIVRAVRAGRDR
ncbi:MAG: type II toxin-antitoxin system Phd/YefM family antitoxin [Tepidisphaeraceae bacterium]